MKKTLMIFIFYIIPILSIGQNLVLNPDFEDGNVPTNRGQINLATGWNHQCTDPLIFTAGGSGVDLLDRLSSNSNIQVPNNIYTTPAGLEERTGDNRYAHLWQTQNGGSTGNTLIGERLKGTLSGPLTEGTYNLCFWGARASSGVISISDPYQIIEVYVVNDNDCADDGKWILTTPTMTFDGSGNSFWSQYCASFSITAAEAGLGYDRILFKIKDPATALMIHSQSVYIDEVELKKECEDITIKIPKKIKICDSDFQEICAPLAPFGSTYTYEWWGPHPTLPMSTLLATTPCFTPSNYGSYLLVITDENGCKTTYSFTIIEDEGPIVSIPDIYYCNEFPSRLIGFDSDPIGPTLYRYSYEWTYNGVPISGHSGDYQIPPMGDGEYCVTINWPSNTGRCSSTTCFTVKECCKPDPSFNTYFSASATSNNLVISNITSHADEYDEETFYIYKKCTGDISWSLLNSFTRTGAAMYTSLSLTVDHTCEYKIQHVVNQICLQKSFVSTVYLNETRNINISPNPFIDHFKITIKDFEKLKHITIRVANQSGKEFYNTTITEDNHQVQAARWPAGLYFCKLTIDGKTYIKKLIKK
ncbi:T9SS type A sorting domain-containing protein [Aquimarina macrocephali]|uniref:T9SS type A sorting domain-containing protein n=1 Tax=Aquimarina macrocephali TaxID=666563 RepID=UPI00046783C1|nr:T9SS type A sorting domain-containing protein [Aquimarina macrocephali]